MNILKISFNVEDGNQFADFIIPASDFKETMEFFKYNLPLDKVTTITIEPVGFMLDKYINEEFQTNASKPNEHNS